MIDIIKCFFGFHFYSKWLEFEGTAGLGSYRRKERYCILCSKIQRGEHG